MNKSKKNTIIKYLLLLAIIIGYFGFISLKYGLQDGFLISLLSWSFFVLCTPIADAGFLIDFPIRLVTEIHMILVETGVWVFAIGLNFFTNLFNPELYNKTDLLKLFKQVLQAPNPYWLIIFLSAIGTFISIYFGDEVYDKLQHTNKLHPKHRSIFKFGAMFLVIASTIILYDYLLKGLGVNLPI